MSQMLPFKSFDYIRLECTKNGHFKFYEIWRYICPENPSLHHVYTRYGKIGTKGTLRDRVLGSPEFARSYYEKTLSLKIGRGYKVFGTPHPTISEKVLPNLSKQNPLEQLMAGLDLED
jgi:predicted DNA-binding WGR domain protein